MSNPSHQTSEALAKEKGIEPDVVISAIEEAVATASRKYYKTGENLKTRFNTETGQVDLFALKTVVEEVATPATEIAIAEAREMYRPLYGDDVANSIELGDEMEFPKPTEVLGRIAAQTAKQVIFQKVREAERENIFTEYNKRVGDVINGIVKRFENGDIIEFNGDPIAVVTNALSPAKVQRVSIVDDHERVMEVVVEDKQLSLAIGKKGQNVRLAAKLTGWRIDIKSEEEKRKEVEAQFGALEAGDAQAQMDALFPETPSGELSAEATTEQSEEGDVAKAEAGDVAAAEETEKQES